MTMAQDGASPDSAMLETMLSVELTRGQMHLCDVGRLAAEMTLLQEVVPRPVQPDDGLSLRGRIKVLLESIKAGQECYYQLQHLQVNRRL